jgi:hypothetical protein
MVKTSTVDNKPVMYVVSDQKTGAVVLTHQTVNVGFGPGPAPAADSHEHVKGLLKRLNVARPETLKIETVDPAKWQGAANQRSPKSKPGAD